MTVAVKKGVADPIDQANLSLSRLMCVSEKFESCKNYF